MNELEFGEFLRSNGDVAVEIFAWKKSYEQVGEKRSKSIATRENKEAEKTIRKLQSPIAQERCHTYQTVVADIA